MNDSPNQPPPVPSPHTSNLKPQTSDLVLLYGGTFDPPHLAHVAQPNRVRQAVHADAVIYMPAAISPLKRDRPPTPAHHRLAMLRLALADHPWAILRTDELDRAADGRPSYTIDTVTALRAELPESTRLRLLIGADQLRLFDQWHESEKIIALAEPLVMVRPPDTAESILNALPSDQRPAWQPRLVNIEPMDISSTAVRSAIIEGAPATDLLEPNVHNYILLNSLYRTIENL
ncbi:MAG: nicotinate (nicotinamide) nucleotide adenylyltransferase [Planctomycetota bacterium]